MPVHACVHAWCVCMCASTCGYSCRGRGAGGSIQMILLELHMKVDELLKNSHITEWLRKKDQGERGRRPASEASLTGGQDVFYHRKHQGQAQSSGSLGSCLPGMVEISRPSQSLPSVILQHTGSPPICHSLGLGKVLIFKQGWKRHLHMNSVSA